MAVLAVSSQGQSTLKTGAAKCRSVPGNPPEFSGFKYSPAPGDSRGEPLLNFKLRAEGTSICQC